MPVSFTDDIFTALDIQDGLQTLYTSGTVFHAFLGQKLDDWKATMNLVRTIAENYKLPYYTMSPTYSVCATHGYLNGEQFTCPHCGAKTEVYSRITGYYRPVQNWNDGKTQEYAQRKTYDIAHSHLTHHGVKDNNQCTDNCECKEFDKPVLFGTTTCPNCKIAKDILNTAHVDYQYINADENAEMAKKLNIRRAPTLVVKVGDKVLRIDNVSDIRKFVENKTA